MEQNSQSGVTSINQLPSSNQIANSIENIPQNANIMNASSMNNIVITKNETINEANTQMQPPMQNPHIQPSQQIVPQNVQLPQQQNNYNELISQLQHASAQGKSKCTARHIKRYCHGGAYTPHSLDCNISDRESRRPRATSRAHRQNTCRPRTRVHAPASPRAPYRPSRSRRPPCCRTAATRAT